MLLSIPHQLVSLQDSFGILQRFCHGRISAHISASFFFGPTC